jgi:hypothetical protein
MKWVLSRRLERPSHDYDEPHAEPDCSFLWASESADAPLRRYDVCSA